MTSEKPGARLTITEAARLVGVSPKTLLRWEKAGKTPRPQRDWRGWRVYEEEDLAELRAFHDQLRRW